MRLNPRTPVPPEYRLMNLVCDQCGASPVEFLELCTATRHRPPTQRYSAMTQYLREQLGREWFMALFHFAKPELRVTVVEETGSQDLRELFARRRLGRNRIKKLAVEYCDRVAYLFGLPVPLDQPGEDTD